MNGYKRTFVTGALLGGLVGLVFAQKSGRELREDLGERSGRLKHKTYDLAKEVKGKGKVLSKDFYGKSTDLIRKVKGVRCCGECRCECGLECCVECCCKCCDVCSCNCGNLKVENELKKVENELEKAENELQVGSAYGSDQVVVPSRENK